MAVAPIVNLWFVGQPVTETIERVGDLAVALGADPDDSQVAADREAFLAAEAELQGAIVDNPGLKGRSPRAPRRTRSTSATPP